MCGEKAPAQRTGAEIKGSPPRVRGKGHLGRAGRHDGGITPACAGKSGKAAELMDIREDHPRVCGEKLTALFWTGFVLGITPACAGKRALILQSMKKQKDHPRVCGEKLLRITRVLLPEGSPPRVRGKDPYPSGRLHSRGITPACAGKRPSRTRCRRRQRDHPRVCGEKLSAPYRWQACKGSPPRVRGKEQGGRASYGGAGITPACAGKRTISNTRVLRRRDHPRVCGEKTHAFPDSGQDGGSPPRVRGKVICKDTATGENGITPACAGKRLKKALKNKDF